MSRLSFLLLLLIFVGVSNSANILMWSAVGSHSLLISMRPFMEALADKGHNITYLSVFQDFDKKPGEKSKFQMVTPQKLKKAMDKVQAEDNGNYLETRGDLYKLSKMWFELGDWGVMQCRELYSDPEFMEWMKASSFDLVIVEMFFNECAFGAVHYWNAKHAIYSATTVGPDYVDRFGLPDERSFISDMIYGFPEGTEMPFLHRFLNSIVPLGFTLWKEYIYLPKLEELTRPAYKLLGRKEEEVPSFREVEKNTTLLFINTHYSMDFVRSFPPNVVQVGGNVVSKKVKPLPTEMKEFLDGAKNGFIYVSFGTFFEFTSFPKEIQVEFVKALEMFPDVQFLWKSATEIELKLPKNVMVTKWAPQQTVLGHPNIKAFISHSGMGGTTESINFGVPVISMPIVGEQDHNGNVIASKGAGIKLELVGLKKEHLENAIREILNNPSYQKKMDRLSKIFKDRPSPPVENAVWWTEYILRHDDINDYILPPGIQQSWWKRRQIDVWLVATALIALIIYIPLSLTCWVLKKLKGGDTSHSEMNGVGGGKKLKRQ